MVLATPLTRRSINRALVAAALDVVTGGRAMARVVTTATTPLADVAIAGGPYHGLAQALAGLAAGQGLTLVREADNPHDADAVAIHGADGVRLGYVPRAAVAPIARLLDEGRTVRAEIVRMLTAEDARRPPEGFAFTGFSVGDPMIRLTVEGRET